MTKPRSKSPKSTTSDGEDLSAFIEVDEEDPSSFFVPADEEDEAPAHGPRRDHRARLVEAVEDWLASGKSYVEVTDLAMETTGCGERTATRAIAEVRKRWKEAEASTVEDRRARFRAMIEHAWAEALKVGDYRAVAVLARTLADVEGIRAPKAVKVDGTLGLMPVAAMAPADRRREIELLNAKRAAAGGTPLELPSGERELEPSRKGKGERVH